MCSALLSHLQSQESLSSAVPDRHAKCWSLGTGRRWPDGRTWHVWFADLMVRSCENMPICLEFVRVPSLHSRVWLQASYLPCSPVLLLIWCKNSSQQTKIFLLYFFLLSRKHKCASVSLYWRSGQCVISVPYTETSLPLTCPHQSYSPSTSGVRVSLTSPELQWACSGVTDSLSYWGFTQT